MYHVACGSLYPWMSDPAITNAWVFDHSYLTLAGSSITAVAPQKGNIPLVGVATHFPAFSQSLGSRNKGIATFDGVSQYLTGHALAALLSGTNKPATLILSAQVLSIAQDKELFRFNGPTGSYLLLTHKDTLDPAQMWVPFVTNDAGAGERNGTPVEVDTAYHTIVMQTDGVTGTMLIDGVVAASNPWAVVVGALTVNQFYVGSGPVTRFCHMKLRSMQFAPSILSARSYDPITDFSLEEAA